ncbi:MAG: hypothetical protein QM497_10615 [Sulfurimonas sp.]
MINQNSKNSIETNIVISEYGLTINENTMEIVLEAIHKFGNARNVLLEGLKPEYQYLKKLSKLLAMLDEKPTYDRDAEKIANLMHDIYKIVTRDSEKKGKNFFDLLKRINVRETFKPNAMELWVMEYLGGRNFIAEINLQEPNQLHRKIQNAIKKYEQTPELSTSLMIENSLLNQKQIR